MYTAKDNISTLPRTNNSKYVHILPSQNEIMADSTCNPGTYTTKVTDMGSWFDLFE